MTLNDDIDTASLVPKAVASGVAFVPGAPFFARAPERNYLRLNFSNRPRALIVDGMKRLAGTVARAPIATPVPPPGVAPIRASG